MVAVGFITLAPLVAKATRRFGHRFQPVGNHAVNRAFRVMAFVVRLAGGDARENLDPFVHVVGGVNMEIASGHRVAHIVAQHQVLDVGLGDEHALVAGEAAHRTDIVKAFNLLVDAANGLHLAALVDRAGDGQPLADGRAGHGRKQRVNLGAAGAVPFHHAIALLKDKAGIEAERSLGAKAAGEEVGDDEHALRVQRAAQVHAPFHVNHVATAHVHRGRDAAGAAKHGVAQAQHRQPVNLAHLLAGRVHQNRLADNGFLHALAHAPGAVFGGVQRSLHVARRHQLAPGFAGPEVGLAHQVGHRLHVGAQPLLVGRLARGVFQQAGHRRAVERLQLVAAGNAGNELGIGLVGFVRPHHLILKVDHHLEQLAELGVILVQLVIEHAVAQQHHLHVERDRLRLQRDGTDKAVDLAQRLDGDIAGAQRPLQPLIGIGLLQQLARIQQQIAAVGLVQRARLNQRVVGNQRAHLRDVLHPAQQILVGGQLHVDHGRALLLAIVHQQIDLIVREVGLVGRASPHQRRQRVLLFRLLCLQEAVHVFDDVLFHRRQVVGKLGQLAEAGAQLVEQRAHSKGRHFLLQLAYLLARLALPERRLAHDALQLLLQLLYLGLDPLLLLPRQLEELLRLNDLAVLHRGKGQPIRRLHQGNVALGGLGAQRLEGLFLPLAQLFFHAQPLNLVLLALEGGRQHRLQLVHQMNHGVAEGAAHAGRQADGVRLVGGLKIVNVDPIGRRALRGRSLLDEAAHGLIFAQPLRAERVEVVPFLVDANAKAHGRERPLLPHHAHLAV